MVLGTIFLHEHADVVIQLLLVILGVHVDEIDNDDSSDVSEPHLVSYFVGSKHVEPERILLLVFKQFFGA